MGWLSNVAAIGAAPFTGGASLAYQSERNNRHAAQDEDAKNQNLTSERMRMMEQGKGEGRELGNRIFGQDQEQTGADVQDIIKRRRELSQTDSKASDAIRSQGQQDRRYAKSKGASDLQQRNTSYQASRAAGLQQDRDYERRLADFQSLVGNIASTQSSLELGGGQLGLASQYIAPPQQDQGLIGGLIGGLGL